MKILLSPSEVSYLIGDKNVDFSGAQNKHEYSLRNGVLQLEDKNLEPKDENYYAFWYAEESRWSRYDEDQYWMLCMRYGK